MRRGKCLLWIAFFVASVHAWCFKTQFAGKDQISSIDFSSDGQYILTSEKSGLVTLWKFNTLEPIRFYNFGNIVEEAVISKDMDEVAVGGDSDDVKILDFDTFGVIQTVSTGHGYVHDLDYRYDNNRLLTCGDDKYIKTWDNSWSNDLSKRLHHQVLSCEFAKDDSMLGSGSHFVEVWKKNGAGAGNNVQQTAEFHDAGTNYFRALRARHDTTAISYLIAACQNGTVLEMAFDGSSQVAWTTSIPSLYAAGYSPDDTYFAVAGSSGKVLMYNATNRVNILEQTLETNSSSNIVSARFSYDSNYFAVGNQNGTIYLFARFCSGCPAGTYKNVTSCRQCYLDLKACAICVNSTVCKACNYGYYLNGNTCSSCDIMEGCALCNGSALCTSCLPGFHLTAGNSCRRCYSDMPGCLQCNDSTTCIQCDNRYALVSNDCQMCSSQIDNCVYCNSTAYCEQCVTGYYENAGSCNSCPTHCLYCQDSTNCTVCQIKYYLAAGSCVPCDDDKCLACNSTGDCFECEEDHYVNSTFECAACIHPCSSCNTSTYCLSCVVGYYISAAGVCTNCPAACLSCNTTIFCESCDSGYYLNSVSHTCVQCHQIDPLCRHCNSTVCLDCEPASLLLSDGSCSPCVDQILNCMLCSNNSICEQCMIGFYATGLTADDSCSSCEPGCRNCENSTECSVCEPGYYFNSADCHLCSNPCYTCSSSTTCLSCREGLYLSTTTCLYCKDFITNCQSCLTNSVCLTCQIGYALTAPNACTVCTHPCTSCETTTTNCLTCAIGYFYSSNSCTRCHSNCTECGTAVNDCTACAVGFYLSGTDCLSCSVDRCVSCSSISQCTECQSGFYPQADGSCLSCSSPIPECLKCSVDGSTCSLCEYGFFLASLNTSCDPCSSNLDNCEHCLDASTCETCVAGFFINSTFECEMCSEGCYSCLDAANCEVCIDTYTLVLGACSLCESSITGCHLCSSTGTCTNCLSGYYLSSGNCVPCVDDLVGCEACLSATHCTSCSVYYQLDTGNNDCVVCSDLYDDCQTCFAGQCKQCQEGSYLDTGLCYPCPNVDAGCIHCDSNSTCTQCMTGYRLVGTLCEECDVAFSNCIYCTNSVCQQCESGYYLNAGACTRCPSEGCEVCLPEDSTKCLTCNSRYYLDVDECKLCSSQLNECMECSDPTICTECSHGFYLDSSSECQLCSDLYDGCSTCTPSSCLDCMANFFLDTSASTHICTPCTNSLPGCSFCSSSSVCLSCQNGYYISGNTCQSCTEIDNCLYCTDSSTCTYCEESYYLDSAQCYLCADIIPSCYACDSSTVCVSCMGHFQLINGECVQIKGEVLFSYPELTLQSYYQDQQTLKHVFSSKYEGFKQIDHDWNAECELWLIDKNYKQITLTIKDVSWSKDSHDMIFLTDNPITQEIGDSMKNMPFLARRRLERIPRLLPQSSLDLTYQFKFMMSEKAIHDVLPSLDHLGDLYLDYPMSDPEFYRSYIQHKPYYHFTFGLTVTLFLFVMYCSKVLVFLPQTKNRGQIIAHIFAIKCGGLALYPTYGEFINYCYGFMTADLPWLNDSFGNALGKNDDIIPGPHAMYYTSLSIASTYFLAILMITLAWFLAAVYGYLRKDSSSVQAFKSFLYNFFNMGAIIAGFLSLEGALLNPIQSLTVVSGAYILGIFVYLGIFIEIVYSIATKQKLSTLSQLGKEKKAQLEKGMPDNFHKLRVFCKGSLLGILHLNPLYFFIALFCFEISAILIDYFLRKKQKPNPKIEFIQHVLINIALAMILCVPNALLGLLVVSLLVLTVIGLDIYINWQEYKRRKLVVAKRENDQSMANMFDEKDNTQANISFGETKKSQAKLKFAIFDEENSITPEQLPGTMYQRKQKKKKEEHTFVIGEIN